MFSPFDPLPFLKTATQQATYIEAALDSSDNAVISEALHHVAAARGEVDQGTAPSSANTVAAIADKLKAFGFRLHVVATE